MLEKCPEIDKWKFWPECTFIGRKDKVKEHQKFDCGFIEVEWDIWAYPVLRKELNSHDWLGNLKITLAEQDSILTTQNSKYDKMVKDNEKLRNLLLKIKRTLLEKLEWEKKYKLDISKMKAEYPMISPLKRKRMNISIENKENWVKRQKTSEDSFSKFEVQIDRSISQRNYHSKCIVWWCEKQRFSENISNKPKTGDWTKCRGSLCSQCYSTWNRWGKELWYKCSKTWW